MGVMSSYDSVATFEQNEINVENFHSAIAGLLSVPLGPTMTLVDGGRTKQGHGLPEQEYDGPPYIEGPVEIMGHQSGKYGHRAL